MKNMTLIAALLAAHGSWRDVLHDGNGSTGYTSYSNDAVFLARVICRRCDEDPDAEASFALNNLDDVLLEATDANTDPF